MSLVPPKETVDVAFVADNPGDFALPLPAAAEPLHATLYKNPQCSCCEGYAAYLRKNGFDVDVKPTNDLTEISSKAGVPERLQGCHTMFVDGYVVDGHVSVSTIRKLLSERPDERGVPPIQLCSRDTWERAMPLTRFQPL